MAASPDRAHAVHINTVAANEAIAVDFANKGKSAGISVYGMNPGQCGADGHRRQTSFHSSANVDPHHKRLRYARAGLIATAIRSNIYGEGMLAYVAESLIGLFTPTPESYAQTIVPLMFAPGLEQLNGTMFGQKGTPILADVAFDDGGAHAAKWIAGMERLAKDKAGV